MPRAVRKSSQPVKGLRHVNPLPAASNVFVSDAMKFARNDWHKRLNVVSGELVKSFKDGMTEEKLRALAEEIQSVGADIALKWVFKD